MLDDPIIETGPTVHNFLVVITQGYISPTSDEVETLVPLGRFLRKYLCVAGMNILEKHITRTIEIDHPRSIECFVIAASLDNMSLCLDALEHHEGSYSEQCAEQGPLGFVPGGDTYNPQNIPYVWCTYMPPEYLWALHRAWAVAKDTPQMMSIFRDLVRSVRGRSCASAPAMTLTTSEWEAKAWMSRDG